MAPIDDDLAASMNALGGAMKAGYRPESRREALFMALQVAAQIVEHERGNAPGLVRFDDTLATLRGLDPEIHGLATDMAGAVFEFGLDSKEAIQSVVDACLKSGFGFTGDPLNLDEDLVVPPGEEPDFDKYPQWLSGARPNVKCDIGRQMALEDIPEGSRTHLENRGDHAMLSFILPDGSTRGPWPIPVPFAKGLMDHMSGEVMRMNQMAKDRQARMLQEVDRVNVENKARQEALMAQAMGRDVPTVPGSPDPTQAPRAPGIPTVPSFGAPFPGGFPGRRPYMSGLGRFLTEARLAERLGGEHPYAYAMNNPTTYVDPAGLQPGNGAPSGTVPECKAANRAIEYKRLHGKCPVLTDDCVMDGHYERVCCVDLDGDGVYHLAIVGFDRWKCRVESPPYDPPRCHFFIPPDSGWTTWFPLPNCRSRAYKSHKPCIPY